MDPQERTPSGEDLKKLHSGEDVKERHSGEGHKERHGEEGQKEIIRRGKDNKEHPKRRKDHKDRHKGEGHKERHGGEGHKERHGGEGHKERHGGERRKSRRRSVEDRRGSSVVRHGDEDHKERHVDEDHKERHGGERRKSRRLSVEDRRGSSVVRHGDEDHKERHGGERRKSRRRSVADRRGSSEGRPQIKRHESQSYQDVDDTQLAKNLRKQVSFTGLPVAEANLKAKAEKGDKKTKKKRGKGDRSKERDGKASVYDVSADEPTSKGTSIEDLVSENPSVNNNARKCKIMGVIGENEPVKVKGQWTFRSFSSRPRDEKGFQDIEFLDNFRDASFSEDDISFSTPQYYPTEQSPCQRGRSRAELVPENVSRRSQDFPAIPPSTRPHLGRRAKTCPGLSRRTGHRIDQRCRSLSLRSGTLR
ncbi:unnamed protein product [Lymnaea stagnalis]|uniref:Uncharacterized protein n=1 Tax=Lymnaea stagnalis TaxID=6523 RepID=A0AAV2H839_LYMST